MGGCTSQDEFNLSTKKIIRAFTLPEEGKLKCMAQMLDVETSDSFITEIKLFFFKNLNAVSQITIENCLFLLGQQSDNCNAGSLFILYDLTDKLSQYTILVNSTYEHFKASLTVFKRDFIVAVGGKNSIKCEIYHRNSNKWRTLPDLPEERYGCGIVSDDTKDQLYCFGGFNSKLRSYLPNVIRVNLKSSNSWENVSIKGGHLIERANFNIVKVGKESVLILGGSTSTKDITDTIVEYEFSHKIANELPLKLMVPCKFDSYSHAEFASSIYVVDDDSNIHIISKKEGKAEIFDGQNFGISPSSNQKFSFSLFESNNFLCNNVDR